MKHWKQTNRLELIIITYKCMHYFIYFAAIHLRSEKHIYKQLTSSKQL